MYSGNWRSWGDGECVWAGVVWQSKWSLDCMQRREVLGNSPDAPVTLDTQHVLHIPPNPLPGGNWIHAVADAVRLLDIRGIVDSGADLPHPDYSPPSPWSPQPFIAARPSSARPKAAHPNFLRQEGLAAIESISSPHTQSPTTRMAPLPHVVPLEPPLFAVT